MKPSVVRILQIEKLHTRLEADLEGKKWPYVPRR